jgi:hypothetical protein
MRDNLFGEVVGITESCCTFDLVWTGRSLDNIMLDFHSTMLSVTKHKSKLETLG